MIYKLQNGGIIKLQKGKIIPNFIDKFKLFIDLSKETKDLKGIRSTDLLKTVHKTDSPSAIRDVADRLYLTKTPLYNSTYSGKNVGDLVGAINYVEETIPSLHGKKWLTVPHNSDLVPTLVNDLRLGADQINIRRNLMDRSLKYIEGTSRILADIAHKSPEYIDQIAQDIKSGKASNVQSYVRELIDQDNRFSRNMNLWGQDDILSSFKTVNGRTLGGDRNKFYMNLGAGDTGYYGPFGAIYQGKPELTGDVSQWWDQRFVHIPNATITHGGLHSGYPEWIRNIHDFENGTTIHRMINMSELFPENYLVNSAHEIISTPEKGLDISPYFDINLLSPYEKYTGRFSKRGYYPTTQYKNGGIIKLQDGIPEINGGELQSAIVKPAPVKIVLRTDPITKDTPITHSSLHAPDFFVSKGSDDPTYNFLKANCSDATGEVLELFTGQDFTSGITTPIGVSRKVRKIYGSKPGYSERNMTSRYQEFEVPWYDYRRAKDLVNHNTLQIILNKYNSKPNIKANVIANWAKERPTLPYYLDEDNNVHYYKE